MYSIPNLSDIEIRTPDSAEDAHIHEESGTPKVETTTEADETAVVLP